MRRITWLRLIQVGVTVLLIVLLIRQVQWPDIAAVLQRTRWELAALSMVPVLLSHLLNVKRWQVLLYNKVVTWQRLLVIYGAGLFANNFLPTGIGGDGVRAAVLGRDVPIVRAAFSVGLDRAIGLFSYTALFEIGWLISPLPGLTSERVTCSTTQIALIVIGVLGLAIVLTIGALRLSVRLRQHVLDWRERWTKYRGTQSVRRWLIVLSAAYVLAALSNLLLAVAYWSIFHALGLNLGFDAAIWLVLASSLSLLLPITVNGLGVMESAFVLVLARYAVSATDAVAAALSVRALMIGFSLLGGLVSLLWRPRLSNYSVD